MEGMQISRRRALVTGALATTSATLAAERLLAREQPGFGLRYLLATCLYGYTDVAEILPEVAKSGATAIDVWPKVHGSQREQIDELGEAQFAVMLRRAGVGLGCITQTRNPNRAIATEE